MGSRTVRPDRGRDVVNERPQDVEERRDHGRASLEAAWRADAEEPPHPETEIEGAGMNEQPLKHVLVPAHMRAPEPAALIEVRAGSFQ